MKADTIRSAKGNYCFLLQVLSSLGLLATLVVPLFQDKFLPNKTVNETKIVASRWTLPTLADRQVNHEVYHVYGQR